MGPSSGIGRKNFSEWHPLSLPSPSSSFPMALHTGVPQHRVPEGLFTLCLRVCSAAPNNLPSQMLPRLPSLIRFCSNVTFQVLPSLATLFKTTHSTLNLHPIILPCFLLSPPDIQSILLILFSGSTHRMHSL